MNALTSHQLLNPSPEQIVFLRNTKVGRTPLRVQIVQKTIFRVHTPWGDTQKNITLEDGTVLIQKRSNTVTIQSNQHDKVFVSKMSWDEFRTIKSHFIPLEVYNKKYLTV